MPAIRTRKSSVSANVTLYEPVVKTAVSPPPLHLRRSTRSQTSTPTRRKPLFDPSDSEDDTFGSIRGNVKSERGDEAEEVKPPLPSTPPSKRKSSSPTKKAPLSVAHPTPKNWERQYEIIREQRKRIIAPVDQMGCEQGGRDPDEPVVELSRKDKKLSTLVSLMLSSQTKDPVTHAATQNLRHNLPIPGLSLESLLGATVEEIDECVKKVGFHTTKAANIKLMAEKVRDEHGGEVPEDLDKLLEFRGVGPKMAYIAMSSYGHHIGIGVDTHVHRITHRLRWHKKEPKTAEETRVNLESWLPRDRWPLVNKMLVGFGQAVCKPVGPRCDLCDLGAAKLCPSRRTVVPPPSPRKPKVKAEVKSELEIEIKQDEGGVEGKPKVEIGIEAQEEANMLEGLVVVKEEEMIKLEVL